MDNNNEGFEKHSHQAEQGLFQAPDIMAKAIHFLIHQMEEDRGRVELTEDMALRFALSERVPIRTKEGANDPGI